MDLKTYMETNWEDLIPKFVPKEKIEEYSNIKKLTILKDLYEGGLASKEFIIQEIEKIQVTENISFLLALILTEIATNELELKEFRKKVILVPRVEYLFEKKLNKMKNLSIKKKLYSIASCHSYESGSLTAFYDPENDTLVEFNFDEVESVLLKLGIAEFEIDNTFESAEEFDSGSLKYELYVAKKLQEIRKFLE